MSLAWTTIAVLVLLLPGFFFYIGQRLRERISRDARAEHAFEQLAGIVFIAFVIHGAAYLTSPWWCGASLPLPRITVTIGCLSLEDFFAILTMESTGEVAAHGLARRIGPVFGWIFVYVVAVSFGAAVVGWGVSGLTARGWLPFLARHRWTHELIYRGNAYTWAYILTTIKEGNRVLMYRGTVKDFFFRPDGQLSYLVLNNCVRYYMVLEGDQPRTTEPVAIGTSRGAPLPYQFVIEGEDIGNVVFETFRVEFTKKGEQALENAAKQELEELRTTADEVARALEHALEHGVDPEAREAFRETAEHVLGKLLVAVPQDLDPARRQPFAALEARLRKLIARARELGW